MKLLRNNNSLIISLLKIGILFFLFIITTDIISYFFYKAYELFLQTTNPQLVVGSNEYVKYLEEQFSNINSFPSVILVIIQSICMIFYVILFWKVFEKKSLKAIGLTYIKSSWSDVIFGIIIGAMSFTLVALVLLCTKSVQLQNGFSKPNFSLALFTQLIVFIFVGINEELFSRGYCINILKQPQKSWTIPIIVSAIIFALLHSNNPGISLLAYVNLFLFGTFMGIIYVKIKNLWMCIGYHIAWNYFQGDVFGFLVSGIDTASIYKIKVINPNIINGGNFGPEGGLVVTILLIVSILIAYSCLPDRKLD